MADKTMNDAASELRPGLLTPRKMLEWRRNTGRMERIRAPESVILTHQASLFKALAPRFGRGRQRGLFCDLRLLGTQRGRLGIAGNFGIGGPVTAAVVEELAEVGVREIVAVDLAASLYAEVASGTIVLVSDASLGDGTSRHYLPNTSVVEVSPDLSGRLASALANRDIGFSAGRAWSTDAVYRETATEVLKYRAGDAVLVDMESAAFLAAGAALGVETASLLVAADTLYDDWQPPPDGGRIQLALRIAARAARECLLAGP
jgi:purine-nucleoside phosphorylase